MNRRTVLQSLPALAALSLLSACSRNKAAENIPAKATVRALNKPAEEWRALVSPAAYKVLFKEQTEPPGSSALNREDRPGTYLCAACYLPLFDSANKYESGTGWPSFTQPIEGHMGTKRDYKMVLPRTEYHCARCGGHQGHVFNDGPLPRGERWCNNGVALRFVLRNEPLPPLRS
ncbi:MULTISPECIES: peptide-methionine (R)-S-oxide reductase MsrB [unclassified Nitrosospira]|uniref:peptide-methionine (R)-S-oxide reductase MsrB n=1 Tax=unclassified Nitrosospira TaxID=2609267 RepID=UPI000D30BAC5|nr:MULTISPECIES: peptide-methionine (R)-S-oxide reductase MsrB [unclassified Nitrosospira]PTR16356.1 peptide-methionine (R)-S-oxide reductase [Nitrosospira sp. Nsp2]WON73656.1 peptide-methionine (R)-S-oxide reductase MsrB [Nitrosospira sp. Is2]